MKRILSAILAGIMLSGSAVTGFADSPVSYASAAAIRASSHLSVTSSGHIDGIDGTITVGELKENFTSAVTVTGADGNAKPDDAYVCTDDTAGGYKAIIYGDVNRDGRINVFDVSMMLRRLANYGVNISTDAADVDKNGKTDLSDVTKMLKKLAEWDDISLGNVRMVYENKALRASDEDSRLSLFFASSLDKLPRGSTTSTGKNACKMKLAKNETESCQFFLASSKKYTGLTVELSDFEHEYGEATLRGEMFIHYYYKMGVYDPVLEQNGGSAETYDYYAEPLLPLADSFEVTENTNQGFHINVTTDKDTPAGMYRATLSVKTSSGKEIKKAYVYTYVWDFTLPDTPYSKSSFGMSGYSIYYVLGTFIDRKWYEGDDHKTHADYYEFLLDNNISSYQLPYPILDSRADALMSDPRVTSFEICGENLRSPSLDDPAQVVSRFNKVQSNPVWAEKGHFYYIDEPWEGGASSVQYQHEYLTNLLGTDDFDIILPFQNSMVDRTNIIDMLDFIQPYVDIFVPGTLGFMPNYVENHYYEGIWTPRQAYAKYGESLPRLMAIKDDPEKELWWYTCVTPQYPYPNLFTSYQGLMNRVLWWQQFMFDVDGYLYWATQYDWDRLASNPAEYPSNGDGTLMYVGEMYGRTGPVASWRLVQVRDGYDDFDYLRIAEKLVGRDTVLKIVHNLTTDVLKVNEDPDVMIACRDAVAELIVANQ